MAKSVIISNTVDMYKKLLDPTVKVTEILIINDETPLPSYEHPEHGSPPLKTVNVGIAAYTTAAARLTLYSYLEKLNTRVLYFHTDSIIYTENPGECMSPTGDFLGDLTNELSVYDERRAV